MQGPRWARYCSTSSWSPGSRTTSEDMREKKAFLKLKLPLLQIPTKEARWQKVHTCRLPSITELESRAPKHGLLFHTRRYQPCIFQKWLCHFWSLGAGFVLKLIFKHKAGSSNRNCWLGPWVAFSSMTLKSSAPTYPLLCLRLTV